MLKSATHGVALLGLNGIKVKRRSRKTALIGYDEVAPLTYLRAAGLALPNPESKSTRL